MSADEEVPASEAWSGAADVVAFGEEHGSGGGEFDIGDRHGRPVEITEHGEGLSEQGDFELAEGGGWEEVAGGVEGDRPDFGLGAGGTPPDGRRCGVHAVEDTVVEPVAADPDAPWAAGGLGEDEGWVVGDGGVGGDGEGLSAVVEGGGRGAGGWVQSVDQAVTEIGDVEPCLAGGGAVEAEIAQGGVRGVAAAGAGGAAGGTGELGEGRDGSGGAVETVDGAGAIAGGPVGVAVGAGGGDVDVLAGGVIEGDAEDLTELGGAPFVLGTGERVLEGEFVVAVLPCVVGAGGAVDWGGAEDGWGGIPDDDDIAGWVGWREDDLVEADAGTGVAGGDGESGLERQEVGGLVDSDGRGTRDERGGGEEGGSEGIHRESGEEPPNLGPEATGVERGMVAGAVSRMECRGFHYF